MRWICIVAALFSAPAIGQIAFLQSISFTTPANVNATSTAWTQTKLSITIRPFSAASVINVRYWGPVQQVNSGHIAESALLKGGTQIGSFGGGPYSSAGPSIDNHYNEVSDLPGTIADVTYTVAVKTDIPGGSIWFPGFGGSPVTIRATEITGPFAPDLIDQLAISDNVLDQQGSDFTNAFVKSEAGLTPKSPTITGRTLVLLAVGQSVIANTTPTPYVPVNSGVDMLSIYTGHVLGGKDPCIGASGFGGSYVMRAADQLRRTGGKFDRVILICSAPGGTSAFDHSTSGVANQRLRVSCLWAKQLGWVGNSNVEFGVIYDQGAQDVVIGTPAATWQAQFANIKASVDGLGCIWKWFVPIDTVLSLTPNATIAGAQAAVVGGSVIAGWNIDARLGANRQPDGTHPSDIGGANIALDAYPIIEAAYP